MSCPCLLWGQHRKATQLKTKKDPQFHSKNLKNRTMVLEKRIQSITSGDKARLFL